MKAKYPGLKSKALTKTDMTKRKPAKKKQWSGYGLFDGDILIEVTPSKFDVPPNSNYVPVIISLE